MSRERFRTVLVVAAFVISAGVFPFLPGSLPRAFGVPSGVEAWISRAISAFFLPAAALLVCRVFRRLSASDPLRANYGRFLGTYNLVVNAGVVLIVGLHAALLVTLLLGPRVWIGYVPPLLVGSLAIAVGNGLPRLRPNEVVGIQTPWARRDERAWALTHRAGGYVLVGFGLLVVAATFLARGRLGWFVGAGAAATLILLVLVSYLAWRAGRRRDSSSGSALPTPRRGA